METVFMAIAVIRKGDEILLRKFDPAKNPYAEPWGLFGGKLVGDGSVEEMLNRDLGERWAVAVTITQRLGWDEEQKVDHDGVEKRFIYLDALCELREGNPSPANPNEQLEWIRIEKLEDYELVPPSLKLFQKLGYR